MAITASELKTAIIDALEATPGRAIPETAKAAWLDICEGIEAHFDSKVIQQSGMVAGNLLKIDANGIIVDAGAAPGTIVPGPHTHLGTDVTSAVANATDADTLDGQHASAFALSGHTHATLPSADEKAALAGTSGSPSGTNKYVTNDDSRNTNARTPTAHASSHEDGGTDEIDTLGSLRLNDLSGTFTRHVVVDADGDLDDTLVWDDLVMPATLVNLTGPATPPAYNETEMTVDFSASADNTVQFNFQLPHGWAEGTDIHFHCHWMPSNTDTGNVIWEHKYRLIDVNGTAGSWTTTTQPEAASGVAGKLVVGAEKVISASGKHISAILQIQLQRLAGSDPLDTFTGIARVASFDCHIQKDSPGSVPEGTKT